MSRKTVLESAESKREPAAIIADAATTLMAVGFVLTARTSTHLEASGPGWTSSKQSPLRAASRVELDVVDGLVRLRAELGGLAAMQRFTTLFPLGMLALFAALIWAGLMHNRTGGVTTPSTYMDLLPMVAVMIPLSALLTWKVRRSARGGLRQFVISLAV